MSKAMDISSHTANRFANDSTLALGLTEPIDYATSGFERAYKFHEKFGLPLNDSPITPTVSERILRARLLLEETIETITKGLGLEVVFLEEGHRRTCIASRHDVDGILDIEHIEGDFYDPVETLDGLADVKVIANGTAVAFGLPMGEADYEVFCSNMSKLDASGKPIVNKCKHWITELPQVVEDSGLAEETRSYCVHQMRGEPECIEVSHLIDPNQPVGKVLKSANYIPANIAGVIQAEVMLTEAQNEGEV